MKNSFIPFVSLILGAGLAFAQAPGPDRMAELEQRIAVLEAANEASLSARWKNGFYFEDTDKNFTLKIGGRVQLDTAFFDADEALEAEAGPFDDGVKFRRAQLEISGNMYGNMRFVTEYNFAGSLGFRNVYLAFTDVPVLGTLRIGSQLEPMGLEGTTGNNYIPFMERSFNYAFNPSYNTGIRALNNALDQRVSWSAGVFKDTGATGDSVSNEAFAVTARLTALPYFDESSQRYLHLGLAMSYRDVSDSGYRFRARPESSIAPYVVDTGALDADTVTIANLEAAFGLGPLSLQGEWSMASPDAEGDDAEFGAWYVMASYFLTGEHRPYSQSSGAHGRIKPNHNATGKPGGAGAWELAVRFDTMDLEDGAVEGGAVDATTLGLNWYLNPHSRIMINYVLADVRDVGAVDIAQMRFQVDF